MKILFTLLNKFIDLCGIKVIIINDFGETLLPGFEFTINDTEILIQ